VNSAIARPRRRWDGNFKIDVEQYDGGIVHLAENNDEWLIVMKKAAMIRVPYNAKIELDWVSNCQV
jgi:hypothetical protein